MIYLIGVLLVIAIILWDAKRIGVPHSVGWAILGFFFGWIGLGGYLLASRSERKTAVRLILGILLIVVGALALVLTFISAVR